MFCCVPAQKTLSNNYIYLQNLAVLCQAFFITDAKKQAVLKKKKIENSKNKRTEKILLIGPLWAPNASKYICHGIFLTLTTKENIRKEILNVSSWKSAAYDINMIRFYDM